MNKSSYSELYLVTKDVYDKIMQHLKVDLNHDDPAFFNLGEATNKKTFHGFPPQGDTATPGGGGDGGGGDGGDPGDGGAGDGPADNSKDSSSDKTDSDMHSALGDRDNNQFNDAWVPPAFHDSPPPARNSPPYQGPPWHEPQGEPYGAFKKPSTPPPFKKQSYPGFNKDYAKESFQKQRGRPPPYRSDTSTPPSPPKDDYPEYNKGAARDDVYKGAYSSREHQQPPRNPDQSEKPFEFRKSAFDFKHPPPPPPPPPPPSSKKDEREKSSTTHQEKSKKDNLKPPAGARAFNPNFKQSSDPPWSFFNFSETGAKPKRKPNLPPEGWRREAGEKSSEKKRRRNTQNTSSSQESSMSAKEKRKQKFQEQKDQKEKEKNKAVEDILSKAPTDDYGILGVTPDIELDAVKIKYKKLTKLVHPDKNNHPGATTAFQRLQNSYVKVSKDLRFVRQHDFQSARMRANQERPPQYGFGFNLKWMNL